MKPKDKNLDRDYSGVVFTNDNYVPKEFFHYFRKNVDKLYEFLHIFKTDLRGIDIDRKENQNVFICSPMDILKKNKKSIDFLSVDHKIYPWTINGNYSPSKLYRNGMIEGSPFNVDSIDFIGVFDFAEEDDASWVSN